MRIEPRRQILDIWRTLIRYSFRDGVWEWGGREESNSLSDAEQLICLLYPATEMAALGLERPDVMAQDVAAALAKLGEPRTIPHRIIEIVEDYIERYTRDGEPDFSGGSYLHTETEEEPTERQLTVGIVDSFSLSVTFCLAALGFLRVYKPYATRGPALIDRIDRLEKALSRRLTAAQVGLVRSFVVNTVGTAEAEAEARAAMIAMVNQGNDPDQMVVNRLHERLRRLRDQLVDRLTLGVNVERLADEDNRLFEIGWGWGIVRDATPVELDLNNCAFDEQPRVATESGIADAKPYLYSTILALDGINDLRASRTRELNLLDEVQRKLADALHLRWELTQRYWSTIARFSKQWPLEDIPWRTSDGEESDYFSLVVSAVLVQDLENREATDDDLDRALSVFEALAQRARITRRVTRNDPAVELHVPGVRMRLGGADQVGPPLFWYASDFAQLLLKRCLQAAALASSRRIRDRLMGLAELTMDHLDSRRLHGGEAPGLWDDPSEALFPRGERTPDKLPSWYMTERVIEALLAAERTQRGKPLPEPDARLRAEEALSEAEHLLSRLLLESDSDDTSARSVEIGVVARRINRAREVLTERPGTAGALALAALLSLDEMNVAHTNALRGA